MSNQNKKISETVKHIISAVRRDGDKALIQYAKRFDRVTLTPKTLRVPAAQIKNAVNAINPQTRLALQQCADRIEFFHREELKRLPKSWSVVKNGVRLGQTFSAVDSVGLYVPGGRFAYPSTVLMTAIPARLAGVKRMAMVTPPARLSNEILAAASLAGVSEIYQVGGPASLAALALGTKTIAPVRFIIGPGNALVTEAKRQLFGIVGIDLLAGPSELVVIADASSHPSYVAADLAAQTEHDPQSVGVLISSDKKLIESVKKQLSVDLQKQCRFYFEPNMKKAVALADSVAGEHVELMVKNPKDWMRLLNNGGTFFIGDYSPAVMGDYWAGPSHVLPTGQSARFASGLSVLTFMKRSGLVEISKQAFKQGWASAHRVAEVEGLTHHADALSIRTF